MSQSKGEKPTIQLEPTFTYEEIAEATGFSVTFVRREAGAGFLKHRLRGRRMVCTQKQIDAWLKVLEERQEDKRACRVTSRDQRAIGTPKRRGGKPQSYKPTADADILMSLGVTTK